MLKWVLLMKNYISLDFYSYTKTYCTWYKVFLVSLLRFYTHSQILHRTMYLKTSSGFSCSTVQCRHFWCLLSHTTCTVTGCISDCSDRLLNSINIYICGQCDRFKTWSLNAFLSSLLYPMNKTLYSCVLSKGWFLCNWILVLMLKIKMYLEYTVTLGSKSLWC